MSEGSIYAAMMVVAAIAFGAMLFYAPKAISSLFAAIYFG